MICVLQNRLTPFSSCCQYPTLGFLLNKVLLLLSFESIPLIGERVAYSIGPAVILACTPPLRSLMTQTLALLSLYSHFLDDFFSLFLFSSPSLALCNSHFHTSPIFCLRHGTALICVYSLFFCLLSFSGKRGESS